MLFVISGYLFAWNDKKSHKERMKSRVRTLFVPYIAWSAFGIGLTALLEQSPQTYAAVRAVELSDPINQYQWSDYVFRLLLYPIPFQLWFIRVLLVYNLLYPLLLRCSTHGAKIWFPLITLIWLAVPMNFGFVEPEGLLFFTLGIWLQKSSVNLETPPRFFHGAFWGIAWILIATIKTIAAFDAPAEEPLFF
jgi:fucose 4-O-acetylase-like acetyltransferase